MFQAAKQPQSAAQRLIRNSMSAVRALCGDESTKSYRRDERGNVAIVFALTSFCVVSMVGGAVDLGRAFSAKSKVQNALDSAALAAASAYTSDPNHNVQIAIDKGTRYFNAIMLDEPGATLTSNLEASTQTVTMEASLRVKTPFLTLVHIDEIVVAATSKATTSQTLGGNMDVELVMMLDTTGSMGGDSGNGTTKIAALRTAASNFVDTLIPDTGTAKAKIGLAPFANTVKLNDAMAQLVTGEPLVKTITKTTSSQCNPSTTCLPATCKKYQKNGVTCKDWNDPVCTTTYETCTSTSTGTYHLSRCMVDRTGNEANYDTAPGTGTYLPATWRTSLASAQICTPTQTIVPMTTNKTLLKNTISTFIADGNTSGALGTGWASYLISPKWDGVFTGEAAPKPYNTAKLKKIAVLMTDGEYNCAASNGSLNSNGVSRSGDGCNNTDTASNSSRAIAICNNMKAQGVEVFTVGFKLDNQTAINTLNSCATDASHAFLAENAAQLEAAFKEIAYQAVPLHLAQ